MTWRKFLALGLLLLLATGGALSAAEPVNANEQKKRIVVLGDSITAGYGLDPSEAYSALLQKKVDEASLNYTVVNAGVSGDTTAGGLRRITWALGKEGAELLLIALGGNDGLRGISPDQTEQNLTGIVEKARAKNPAMKIVIIGMRMPDNMGADYTTAFKGVFPKVAAAEKTELIPYLLEGVGGDEKLNQADRIHPTAEGQRIIAEHLWAAIKGML
jgi:acyl-CoA thioesterase-1